MKRILFFVSLLFILFLTGCTCNPSNHSWNLVCYNKEVEFINGVTRKVSFDGADYSFPFALASHDETNIRLSDDGTVSFSTCDGELLEGTYTCKNIGLKHTSITLTFNNEQSVNGYCSNDPMDFPHLEFTFRDVRYVFEQRGTTINFASQDYIIKELRHPINNKFHSASITKSGDNYIVSFDNESLIITAETAVCAMRLDENNNLTQLSEISEGECFMTYLEYEDIVTLYYVEPEKPEILLLSDVAEWIKVVEDSEIIEIEIYETDTDGIEKDQVLTEIAEIRPVMDLLRNFTISPVSEEINFGELPGVAVRIYVRTDDNKLFAICMEKGYIQLGQTYKIVNEFPGFSNINRESS